jgi:ATP-dependent exoDNAse (exonuclease V) beta subunit
MARIFTDCFFLLSFLFQLSSSFIIHHSSFYISIVWSLGFVWNTAISNFTYRDFGFSNFAKKYQDFTGSATIFQKGKTAIEEERNIAFVAITRARRFLYISYPKVKEMPWGDTRKQDQSQFISEIRKNFSISTSSSQ